MPIGFIRRLQLTKKFHRALEKNKFAKAAVIDAHFRDLVADEKPKDIESKSASFRKGISAEDYLVILKEQYRRAQEEDRTERAQQIEQIFIALKLEEARKEREAQLSGDEAVKIQAAAAAELSATITTVSFVRRKLETYQKRAIAYRQADITQRSDKDISDEKTFLLKLIDEIQKLRDILTAKNAVRDYHLPVTTPPSVRPAVSPRPQVAPSRKSVLLQATRASSGKVKIPVKNLGRSKDKEDLPGDAHSEARRLVDPLVVLEQDINARIAKDVASYEARIKTLERTVANRAKDASKAAEEAAKKAAYAVSNEVREVFLKVLEAFPPRNFVSLFSKRKRTPFDHEKFITNLNALNNHLASQGGDAMDKTSALMNGLLYLFGQMSNFQLKLLRNKVNHPTFKNFYKAVVYYGDTTGQTVNVTQLGLGDTDGLKELGPLAELQTLNAYFIEALQLVLEERRIPYKNRFTNSSIERHDDVRQSNQDFIRKYVTETLAAGDRFEIARRGEEPVSADSEQRLSQ